MDDGHPCSSTRHFKIFCLAKANRHGNGIRWRQVLPFPSSYPTSIFLLVTLPISSGDEKSNLIPVSDGFGYPCLILIRAVDIFL
ncbi:hypothetical protein MTR_7g064770 [Medicago truncatula]|uniref:Uncharacterized protein n=1 Tax=Medicago truncatula TaxID=3880 RepID=G7L5I5_MEDTR|nr:hypothetical protein MTR_7g064770 [Medicago truncatula]